MDSLGGMLTGGLLGNMVLAQFSFGFNLTIEEVTPTPTPYPSPTPVPSDWTGGRSHAGSPQQAEEERTVRITIRYKSKEYSSTHTLNDRKLRIAINIVRYLNKAKDKLKSISLAFKSPTE